MNAPILYLSGISIFLSLITFFYNKGYQRANRFFAGTLFFAALQFVVYYVCLYSDSIQWVAFFTSGFPSLSFLIGPLAYFYVRSILKDSTKISGWDYLHFLPFIVVFTGIVPYIFASWDYKLKLAELLMSDNWKESHKLHANRLFTGDQKELLGLIQTCFYMAAWWVPFFKQKEFKPAHSRYQWNLIKKWLFLFCVIMGCIDKNSFNLF